MIKTVASLKKKYNQIFIILNANYWYGVGFFLYK